MTRPEAALIDELEFRSYVHNRMQFPDVEPERWALIFSNVPEMEERYLDMLSTGNILDAQPTYHTSRGGNSNGLHVAQGSAPESDRHSASSELDGAQKRNGCVVQMDMPRNDAVTAGESSSSAAIQVLDVADRATGNAPVTDGLQVGDEGVSNCGELPLGADAAGTDVLGRRLATHPLRNEQLADSQTSTPLYLLASEIVGKVTKGYEQ